MDQPALQGSPFSCREDDKAPHQKKAARSGAFTDNMRLPVHRWFRYSAGFSAEWAEKVIRQHRIEADDYVFDPFAGSGTTLIAAERANVRCVGTEYHGFVHRIARAKLLWGQDEQHLLAVALRLSKKAQSMVATQVATRSELLRKCYLPDALCRLEALKNAFLEEHQAPDGPIAELLWLAITAILRECSGVGTAQWQYVLPNKTKARVQEPFAAFLARVKLFCADMQEMKRLGSTMSADIVFSDARDLSPVSHLENRVKLVITSPPYPNNYDYADATRLEMTFWGEIESWGDLQKVIRHRLVRSCSQHSAIERLALHDLLAEPAVAPISEELTTICRELEAIRGEKGGRKTYHTMVAAYFVDLAKTWRALWPLCREGAAVCFVIGDSAPYGVHVPADRWLGELAIAAGFKTFSFEKIRDRNVKWKNRKHRVPLKEGHLWVGN
jgi:hypothetical protein